MINSKHEIIREAFKISRHGLIDYFRFNTIHLCKVTVEHDPLATNLVNLFRIIWNLSMIYDSSFGAVTWPEFTKALIVW